MSYSCSFVCFDPTLADLNWAKATLQDFVNYDDNELLYQDIEWGTVSEFSPEDSKFFMYLLDAHHIKYVDYPTLDNLHSFLGNLDKDIIRQAIAPGSAEYRKEITGNFDDMLATARELVENGDPDTTVYSIEGFEKYIVPLCEAHGILLYSKATKAQFRELLQKLTPQTYEKAVNKLLNDYTCAVSENEQGVVGTLRECKAFVMKAISRPDCRYVFIDDGGIFPINSLADRLPIVKGYLTHAG